MRELVSALIDASPVPCVPVGELELPAYYDSSQQTIFVKKGLSEEVLFVSMAKEVSAAVYDFKYNESRDASDFKSFCVADPPRGCKPFFCHRCFPDSKIAVDKDPTAGAKND